MTDSKIYIGVDVGKAGGLCVMRSPTSYDLYSTNDDNNVYHDDMLATIKYNTAHLFNSKQDVIFENMFGNQSNWLNRAVGFLMSHLRAHPTIRSFDFVSTGSWKKSMQQLIPEMKGNTSQKDYHKLIKQYLNKPNLTHDQCAAYGIAYWGWCQDNKESE